MNHSVISSTQSSSPWRRVRVAFSRALTSQLHPKMLAALVMPFLVALLGAVLLLWFFWTPLKEHIALWLTQWGIFTEQPDLWLVGAGLFAIKFFIVPLLTAGALLPIAGIAGLIVSAVLVMPLVLAFVQKKQAAPIHKHGQFALSYSAGNALWVGFLFIVGWLVTLPLWLIGPLALILPVFWWAFAFTRLLRVDSMVEHASAKERKILLARHNKEYWFMGMMLSLLNLLPLAWFVLPVFSALVFAHFNLAALAELRAEQTEPMELMPL
ncbi:EI24 domain-containing protein [Paenalcaligenes hominis]|uniref:EI24 domain-containing protein n=1 Tax=Paenalcaligenes hominis TaxID=643674 RepID=UPI003526AE04